MMQLRLCLLLLYVALSVAELLGPNSRRKEENSDDDDDEVKGMMRVDGDYEKPMSKSAVNKKLKELREYILATEAGIVPASLPEDEEEQHSKLLEEIEGLSKKITDEHTWFKDMEMMHDENDEMLVDPDEPETSTSSSSPPDDLALTPELRKAKALYDAAMTRLKRRTPDVDSAIQQIKEAAERGYIPAQVKLAWSYVYGEGVELDIDKARDLFDRLSKQGNAEAHAGMGFLHAQGLGVPVSQARALVHYAAGALGDSSYALMALAYRYWSGHTVPASCPTAMHLYMKVAAKVASSVSLSGGPAIQRVRLLEESEGNTGTLDTDLIEYYQLLAEKGDVQAQVGLGQLHFQGGRGVTLDVSKALHYFNQAANAGNAVANAFMGKIFLEGGDGIKPDNETALKYFKKAAELNNPVGQSGLGLMYLQGRGVPKDTTAAFKYFSMAANQGWAEGQLHLGFMYFGGIGVRRDFKQANKYFSLASQSGHVLAFYHLAQMHAQGLGVLSSCSTAVELFKNVCERGSWGARLMSGAAAWRRRDTLSAFTQYAALAERGLEVAQTNAAYLLDNGEVGLFSGAERWRRALQLWGRAAAQGYSAARVKLGDYHYYGLGTGVDLEHAAHHYRIASEQQHNAQATFNLGYMHSLGVGLTRDLHLAKRCFDLAADTAPDARLPAALALAALAVSATARELGQSPLAVIFLGGDSALLSNWDLYLITVLLGALGLVVYWRRPQPRPPQPN